MRTPAQVIDDILLMLDIDGVSQRKLKRAAKVVYSVQRAAFREAAERLAPGKDDAAEWFKVTRKFGLNGAQGTPKQAQDWARITDEFPDDDHHRYPTP